MTPYREGDELTVTFKGKIDSRGGFRTEGRAGFRSLVFSQSSLLGALIIERAPVELVEGELYVDANGKGWACRAFPHGGNLYLVGVPDEGVVALLDDIPTRAPGLRRAKLTPA